MPKLPASSLRNIESDVGTTAPSTSGIEWSPQQLAVFDGVHQTERSIEVVAVAGSGKTTTIVEAAKYLAGDTAFAAFNKRIADEIKVRVSHLPRVDCGTMHSYGLRAWQECTGTRPQVEARKLENLLDIPFRMEKFTIKMVGLCKQSGMILPLDIAQLNELATHFDCWDLLPEAFQDDPWEFVGPLLQASIDSAHEVIDFDDMLYMPLRFGKIEPKYDNILVDEAQDTNGVRRHLVAALLRDGGRVIVVGDPHQAIYGFTGADADAMSRLSSQFGCIPLPLTVTYRCPKRIVAHAQQWVSHIQAADSAPEGIVRDLTAYDFGQLNASHFTANDVILCRNTRPLIETAIGLLRRGIGCRVEGRDIGQAIDALIKKFKADKTVGALIDTVDEHKYKEANKFRSRGNLAKAAAVEDRCDSLIALGESMTASDSTWALSQKVYQLFGDTVPGQAPKVCTLSTVHKAKGREWDKVYLLGREELMPSKYAKQEWELEQEKNLCYVAVTRAKKELVEVPYVG